MTVDRDNVVDIAGNRVDDDHLLSMYIDGELDAERTIALITRLRTEPVLRSRLEAMELNDSAIKRLFSSADHSVTTRLAALVRAKNVSRISALSTRQRWTGGAIAASLAAVLTLAINVNQSYVFNPMSMDPQLAGALEHSSSRASGWETLGNDRMFRGVLTFPAADGRWCREFLLAQNESQWRGVACRDGGEWVNQVVGSEVFLEQETQYRPAGVADSEQVARFIDETATDVALGPQQEAALIASGW